MTFKDIKNNDKLIKRVSNSIINGNISHAYIFEGGSEKDRKAVADAFTKAVLCGVNPGIGCDSCIVCRKIEHGNHEDIIFVEKDVNSIKDEAIEELQKKLKKKPFAGERNIAVIKDADTMTSRANNRLLKTLEEPFAGTVIILLSDHAENFTKTIISRCAVLRWNPFTDDDSGGHEAIAEEIIQMLISGTPSYARRPIITNLAEDRDSALKTLSAMESVFGRYAKERCYGKEAIRKAVSCIEEAQQDLKRGLSSGYSLKNMMLKIENVMLEMGDEI